MAYAHLETPTLGYPPPSMHPGSSSLPCTRGAPAFHAPGVLQPSMHPGSSSLPCTRGAPAFHAPGVLQPSMHPGSFSPRPAASTADLVDVYVPAGHAREFRLLPQHGPIRARRNALLCDDHRRCAISPEVHPSMAFSSLLTHALCFVMTTEVEALVAAGALKSASPTEGTPTDQSNIHSPALEEYATPSPSPLATWRAPPYSPPWCHVAGTPDVPCGRSCRSSRRSLSSRGYSNLPTSPPALAIEATSARVSHR